MARQRLLALRRTLKTQLATTGPVHFHNGPQGQPAACHDEACTSPRLDVR